MNGKKRLVPIMSTFMICFYIVIVLFTFFAVLHIDVLSNFLMALVFEIIGFVLLAYFILGNVWSKSLKVGYFVPLLMVTVIYTILLDVINMLFVATMIKSHFILVNLILLFVYCMIAIPMYVMGKNNA